uniref:Uncharacterized protein n=1 Tax=viral metagenome TaxID=1070528 RepID=A0A6H1Z918_9ZZZZ
MGTTYYMVCNEKKTYVVLDKFYTGAFLDSDRPQDFFRTMAEARDSDGRWKNWEVIEAFKAVAFAKDFGEYGIEFVTEHMWCPDGDDDEEWKELLSDPRLPRGNSEQLDLSGTSAPTRAIINTPYGEVYLDVQQGGINVFSDISGLRVDFRFKRSGERGEAPQVEEKAPALGAAPKVTP